MWLLPNFFSLKCSKIPAYVRKFSRTSIFVDFCYPSKQIFLLVTRLKNILIIKFKSLLILESSLIISSFEHLFYLAYSLEYCSRFIDMLDQTGHGCSFSL